MTQEGKYCLKDVTGEVVCRTVKERGREEPEAGLGGGKDLPRG